MYVFTKKSVARRKKNGTCVFFLFCFFRLSVLNKGVMNTFSALWSWGEKDQRAHLPPDFHFHFHEAHWSADFHLLFLLKTENIPRPLIISAFQIVLVCRHFWLSRLMENRTVSYWLGWGRTPWFFIIWGRFKLSHCNVYISVLWLSIYTGRFLYCSFQKMT